MKQCPVCKNTYTDESLIFCLSDGTRLTSFYEAEKTQALPPGINPTQPHHGRVSIPVGAPTMETKIASIAPPTVNTVPAERKGCRPLVMAGILGLLGILAVAGIVIAYFAFKDSNTVAPNNKPAPTPIISPTNSNSNEQALKDKLDQLQKQLDDQKKAANKTPVPMPSAPTPTAPPPPPINSSSTTATVNSPGDGFLAMRSGPSHQSGYQITKMPHSATVTVYSCQGTTTIAGKTGRWCQVSYGGYSGWAFDAWLVY